MNNVENVDFFGFLIPEDEASYVPSAIYIEQNTSRRISRIGEETIMSSLQNRMGDRS